MVSPPISKDIKARLRCFLIITVPSDSGSEMLKGFLTKVKVVKHKTHRYFLFLHDAMCNEMLSKTTSSRRSGIIHARQLGLCTRWFGQHWKHRCINIFQEEISKLQVFLQISFDYLDFSQQSFLQKWAARVFLNFLYFFYFLVVTAIFLNFPASFLYFCPEIGGIDYVSSWHLYQTFLAL